MTDYMYTLHVISLCNALYFDVILKHRVEHNLERHSYVSEQILKSNEVGYHTLDVWGNIEITDATHQNKIPKVSCSYSDNGLREEIEPVMMNPES